MSGPGGVPQYGQNNPKPKSILAERNPHQQNVGLESDSLRVTFAKLTGAKHSTSSTMGNVQQKNKPIPPKVPGKRPGTPEEINRKLQFHAIEETKDERGFPQNDNTYTNNTRPAGPVTGGLTGADRVRAAYQRGLFKQGRVDVLFPDKMNKPKIMAGSSIGGMLTANKSDDSVSKSSKNSAETSSSPKSKSRTKKLSRKASNRSTLSSSSRKTKSGKKIKKRKKSKFDDELEKELQKPAQLNEEYAQELNKITQILRAVTAFDEATSTENSAVQGTASGRNNVTTFYTYTGGSNFGTGGTTVLPGLAPTKPNPRRPLSGHELKQLLSSITRIVSLHQLPIDNVNNAAKQETGNNTKPENRAVTTKGQEELRMAEPIRKGLDFPRAVSPVVTALSGTIPTPSASPPTSNLKEAHKVYNEAKAPVRSPPLGTPSVVSASTAGKGRKRKKRRMFKQPTFVQGSRSEPVTRTKTGFERNNRSKSKASFGRKTKPKNKSATDPSRPHSKDGGSSVSSLEKDPVKNATFLRNYFEETVRLANKRSSEDQLAQQHNETGASLPPTVNSNSNLMPATPRKSKKALKRRNKSLPFRFRKKK